MSILITDITYEKKELFTNGDCSNHLWMQSTVKIICPGSPAAIKLRFSKGGRWKLWQITQTIEKINTNTFFGIDQEEPNG
jgi:hypothetical protein